MARRALIFVTVFFALIAGLYYYIFRQVQLFLDLSADLRVGAMSLITGVFLLVLSLPIYFWKIRRQEMSETQKKFLHGAYYSLAYINFLIPLILFRDLLTFLLMFVFHVSVDFLFTPAAFGITFLGPVFLTLLGHLKIRQGPQVFHHRIEDPRLPSEFHELRVAQISDLHISMFLVEGFVEKMLAALQELAADVVILTGDIIDGPLKDHAEELEKLAKIQAPHGVFYVPGNHEYYWGLGAFLEKIESLGIRTLMNSGQAIRRNDSELLICGIPDTAAAHFEGEEKIDYAKLGTHFRDNQYRILLSHQPSQADHAVKQKIHAQFSGHTHAGQFFPWNLLIGLFQKYARGGYRIHHEDHWLHLYVNQGTAYWGPALRLGTHCELTLVTFAKAGLA